MATSPSHAVLQKAVETVGAKRVAHNLKISPALIYKWCQPRAGENQDGSGTRNPLDRVAELYRSTGDAALVEWLCREANGFFTRNPPTHKTKRKDIVIHLNTIIREFSEMIQEATTAVENDGVIDPAEARRIRAEWEKLKSVAESFVCGCEGPS
jgi:hypothetical protein